MYNVYKITYGKVSVATSNINRNKKPPAFPKQEVFSPYQSKITPGS
ncbi:hypothetical protein C900_00185 [Fulvivirga imtechensis AK7]|uniref:Uncharacterized protein n=1 Tax=Fulvivirga imtechensis AK7 TaxID=1237149 RepID=L8JID8_9BACT|nr:hypothetical protein C900_00185 [Fulvivirga imtechensis AK7]